MSPAPQFTVSDLARRLGALAGGAAGADRDEGARPPVRLPRWVAYGPGRGGQPRLLIDAPAGGGEIYLHGATLTSWRPRGGREVLFTSRRAVFDGERAIRGGVPVCSPWFGSGARGDRPYKHGWVRLARWDLRSVETTPERGVRVLLGLDGQGLSYLYEVVVGERLEMTVSVRNTGGLARPVEVALHHYLSVGDVTAVRIHGLEGEPFRDCVADPSGAVRPAQTGPVLVDGPIDRVYHRVGAVRDGGEVSRGEEAGDVTVDDPAGGRVLRVRGRQAPGVVVWNPWSGGAAAMADMGDEEWAEFVCVESARLEAHGGVLEPGQSVSAGSVLSVEPL